MSVKHTFEICRKYVDDLYSFQKEKYVQRFLDLYNQHAIIAEPAGALSIAALDFYKDEIKGKSVVCVISGGNNDIGRMQEIKEKSLFMKDCFTILSSISHSVLGHYDNF